MHRISHHEMSLPTRVPAKPLHDFGISLFSEVKKLHKVRRRSIASLKQKVAPLPPGISDATFAALKYLSKNVDHLLRMQLFLTLKSQERPDGFASKSALRRVVKEYNEHVRPLRSELKEAIRVHNSALDKGAPDNALKPLKDRAAALEEEMEEQSAAAKLPAWAGCTVKDGLFLRHVSLLFDKMHT